MVIDGMPSVWDGSRYQVGIRALDRQIIDALPKLSRSKRRDLREDMLLQADDVRAFGCTHTETQNGGVAIDKENKIFTTPCYMLNATLKDIYDCAWNMVEAMKDL